MALILVLIFHARAECEWFSLHWYVSKHHQHHLLPDILPNGKKVREQAKEKGKAHTKFACKRATVKSPRLLLFITAPKVSKVGLGIQLNWADK